MWIASPNMDGIDPLRLMLQPNPIAILYGGADYGDKNRPKGD